jgi:hypothetical protein
VPELIAELKRRGLKTALATSSNLKQLATVEKYSVASSATWPTR